MGHGWFLQSFKLVLSFCDVKAGGWGDEYEREFSSNVWKSFEDEKSFKIEENRDCEFVWVFCRNCRTEFERFDRTRGQHKEIVEDDEIRLLDCEIFEHGNKEFGNFEDFGDDEDERIRPKFDFMDNCCLSFCEEDDGVDVENDEHVVELNDTVLEQRRCDI